jgi:hypothetical protein
VDPEKAEKAQEAMALGIVLVILGLALAYALAVLLMGAWVARDAYRRGLPGLGWATFYYLFQLLGRLVVFPLAIVPTLLLPGVGPFILLAGEPIAWLGIVVYLYARRPGRLTACHNCQNRLLDYLLVCPHCGLPERPYEPAKNDSAP